MGGRLLTALGAAAAAVAVIAAFALLFGVLDDGGDGAPARTTVIRVSGVHRDGAGAVPMSTGSGGRVVVPGGQASDGKAARAGRPTVGAKVPRRDHSAGAGAGAGAGGGASESGPGPSGTGSTSAAPAAPPRPPTLLGRPLRGTAFEIAHVREGARVDLRSAPGGPLVARLGDKTEFGSPVSFSVVATRPGWLGVTAPEVPDGELAWIARDPRKVDVYWTRWSIHADLAARSLELRYGRRPAGRFAVTIGGPGTETPPGRYGVTDGISFEDSPYYGCCALALSGHQTHQLPAGWIGGDRLAIHGTPGAVGNAESLGCIRATDETLRYLFRRVPLGTPVMISG